MGDGRRGAWWGEAAAASWVLLVVLWFDPVLPAGGGGASSGSPWPAALAALTCAAALAAWVRARRDVLRGPAAPGPRHAGLLAVLLAVAFRLPLAWQGGAGYVTADGALSGIVALDARDGRAHHVFVPEVPYSGSLKSHLTAPLAAVMDPARAFALVSVAFYALFVAALVALVRRADPGPLVAAAAGLYAAFAPPFVTRYSLSNDGNYVEVLALGTAALLLAARWAREEEGGRTLATVTGLLLGLAFWCHILAVIHVAAVGLTMLLSAPRRALRDGGRAALGFALGDAPGLFWNAYHGGESFLYLVPGALTAGSAGAPGPGVLTRAAGVMQDHLPVLAGYDFGYPRPIDRLLVALATGALAAAAAGWIAASRDAARGDPFWRALVVLTIVNLPVAALALPYIPGNARYVLFLAAPLAAFVARALRGPRLRPLLVLLVVAGAAGSLAQASGTLAADREWRGFVAGLRAEGVRWCDTDFFLATKINFLSAGAVTCSSKLGPTTTEYFFRFRDEVEAAPEAALVAVNATAAEKLERRLDRLGVRYERRDLMKPVLLRLSRKVDPEELFPGRGFPLR